MVLFILEHLKLCRLFVRSLPGLVGIPSGLATDPKPLALALRMSSDLICGASSGSQMMFVQALFSKLVLTSRPSHLLALV